MHFLGSHHTGASPHPPLNKQSLRRTHVPCRVVFTICREYCRYHTSCLLGWLGWHQSKEWRPGKLHSPGRNLEILNLFISTPTRQRRIQRVLIRAKSSSTRTLVAQYRARYLPLPRALVVKAMALRRRPGRAPLLHRGSLENLPWTGRATALTI